MISMAEILGGISDFFGGILNTAADKLDGALSYLSSLCPFTGVIDYLRGGVDGAPDWLRALNWFVPMGEIVFMMEMWGLAILAWYAASIALRWIKAVE